MSNVINKTILREGEYKATIKDMKYLREQKTNYGLKDILSITYVVIDGLVEVEKTEKIFKSDYKESRWKRFCKELMPILKEIYPDGIPKVIKLEKLIGRKLNLKVIYNKQNNVVYDNIVSRVFEKNN